MKYKDYYEVLGVARDVDQAHIKRAFRKLARKYHPDLNKEEDAEANFKELNEAYEVLKDPEKRVSYDQLGADWQSGQNFKRPPNWDEGFEYTGSGYEQDFAQQANGHEAGGRSDFFESLFGQAFRNASKNHYASGFESNQNNDHHAKVIIDLEDSLNGTTKTISLRIPELGKQGQLQTAERVLNVKIPKGVTAGQHIRLSGQAFTGADAKKAGDLYLEVEFKAHKFYRVEGKDLYYDLPVTPWEAALGATIITPTPKGMVDLKIPAGSTTGQQLRLKNQGIPGKTTGNLVVVLKIVLPAANTEESKKVYQEMEKKLAFNPRQHLSI